MLGKIFSILVITSFICAGATGNMASVCNAAIEGATEAVNISIHLLGIICLWSGIISTLDNAGFTKILAKIISPLLRIIYPESYKKNIAINDIAADYSANLMGLGNAALPIGIRVMNKLKKLDLNSGDIANTEMIMFAVLNTAPIQLIPTTLIALRSAHNSSNPFEIIFPIWVCSILTFTFGILLCKFFQKYSDNTR